MLALDLTSDPKRDRKVIRVVSLLGAAFLVFPILLYLGFNKDLIVLELVGVITLVSVIWFLGGFVARLFRKMTFGHSFWLGPCVGLLYWVSVVSSLFWTGFLLEGVRYGFSQKLFLSGILKFWGVLLFGSIPVVFFGFFFGIIAWRFVHAAESEIAPSGPPSFSDPDPNTPA